MVVVVAVVVVVLAVVVVVVVVVVIVVVVVSNIPQADSSGTFLRTIHQKCPIGVVKVILKKHSVFVLVVVVVVVLVVVVVAVVVVVVGAAVSNFPSRKFLRNIPQEYPSGMSYRGFQGYTGHPQLVSEYAGCGRGRGRGRGRGGE